MNTNTREAGVKATALTLHDQLAQRLVLLKADFYAKSHAAGNAARDGVLTLAHTQTVLDAGAAVDKAADEFRRQFYPRTGRIVASESEVYTVSPQGRNMRLVWSR